MLHSISLHSIEIQRSRSHSIEFHPINFHPIAFRIGMQCRWFLPCVLYPIVTTASILVGISAKDPTLVTAAVTRAVTLWVDPPPVAASAGCQAGGVA